MVAARRLKWSAATMADVKPHLLERHPISAAFDSLDPDESHALYDNVRERGVVGRIIIGHVHDGPEHSGRVIDGWNVLCAWKDACRHDDRYHLKHPIEPHIEDLWFGSVEEMEDFALAMQLGRRNQDQTKRALLVVRQLSKSGRADSAPPIEKTTEILPPVRNPHENGPADRPCRA
jgi:hypothetical protein